MSVKPVELIKQSVNVILCVLASMCLNSAVCVCACCCVFVSLGKTIRQCFDSHVTRRESVSGDPAMRTPDYPSVHDSYI